MARLTDEYDEKYLAELAAADEEFNDFFAKQKPEVEPKYATAGRGAVQRLNPVTDLGDLDVAFNKHALTMRGMPKLLPPQAKTTPEEIQAAMLNVDPAKYSTYRDAIQEAKETELMKSHGYDRAEARQHLTLGTAQPTFSEAFDSGLNGLPEPIRGYNVAWIGAGALGRFVGDMQNTIIPTWNGLMSAGRGVAVAAKEYTSAIGGVVAESTPVQALGLGSVAHSFTGAVTAPIEALAEGFEQDRVTNETFGDASVAAQNRPLMNAIFYGTGNFVAQAAAFVAGGPGLGLATAFGMETGLAYDQLEAEGRGKREDWLLIASGQGAVAGALELLPLSRVASAFAGRGTRNLFSRLSDIGLTSVSEGLTEGATSFGQAAIDGMYSYYLGQESSFIQAVYDEVTSPETIMDAKLSALAGLAVGGGVSAGANYIGARRDTAQRQDLSQKLVATKQTLSKENLPPKLQEEFLSTVNTTLESITGQKGAVKVKYDKFTRLFQSDEDTNATLTQMGFTPEEVLEAKDAGVPLELSFSQAIQHMSEDQLEALPTIIDSRDVSAGVDLLTRQKVARNLIADVFSTKDSDSLLGVNTSVVEAYGRVDAFASGATDALELAQGRPMTETQRNRQMNVFRRAGLLLESRAAVLEETFGVPRQDTWDRWNLQVRALEETTEGLREIETLETQATDTPQKPYGQRRTQQEIVRELIAKATPKSVTGHRGVFLTGLDESGAPVNIIGLFKTANVTTAFHELGHFFLNDLANVAQEYGGDVPIRAVEDLAAVREFLGVEPGQEGFTTEQQEKFAQTWEAYLFEGVVPAAKGTILASVLNKCSQYMKSVYKSVLRLGGTVSPEMKDIFDRMISTEGQLAGRVDRRSYTEEVSLLYSLHKAGGLDLSVLNQLSAVSSDVLANAESSLDKQKLKDFRKQQAKARQWAAEQYSKDPDIQVIRFFTTPTEDGRVGLDRQWVLDNFGDSGYYQIRDARGTNFIRENGITPFELSETTNLPFNFDEFYRILVKTPTRKKYTQLKVDEYNTLADARLSLDDAALQDQAALDEQIQVAFSAALNNMFGVTVTPKPLRTIKREAMQGRGKDTLETIKKRQDRLTGAAIQIENSLKALIDVAKGYVYVNNMPTNTPALQAKKTALTEELNTQITELGKILGLPATDISFVKTLTDIFTAREQLRAQREQMRLATRQRELMTRADKALTTAHKRAKKGGFYSNEYNAAIESMVAILNPKYTSDLAAHGETLRKFLAQNNQEVLDGVGFPVFISEESLALYQNSRTWNSLTFDEKMRLYEEFAAITTAGRSQYKINQSAKKISQDEAAELLANEWLASPLFSAGQGFIDPETGMILSQQARKEQKNIWSKIFFNKYTNLSARMEFLFANLSNAFTASEVEASVSYQLLFNAFNKSNTAMRTLIDPIQAEFDSILIKYSNRKGADYFYENVTLSNGATFSRQELFSMMLNTGTQSNLAALLNTKNPEGNRTLSEPLLWEVMGKLDKADWDNIQALWNCIGRLAAPLAAKTKALTGRDMVMEPAQKIVTPYGEYEGGYWPLVPDREVQKFENIDKQDNIAPIANMMPELLRSSAPTTHANKTRTGGVWAVSTDLNIGTKHIQSVGHWITHIEACRDVNGLLTHPKVKDAVQRTAGADTYNTMLDWVKSVANPVDIGAQDLISRGIRWARLRAPMQWISLSAKTIATVGTGNILVSLRDIPAGYLGRSTQQAVKDVRSIITGLSRNKTEATIFSNMLEKSAQSRELFDSPDRLAVEYLQNEGRNALENMTALQRNRVIKSLGLDPRIFADMNRLTNALARKSWRIISTAGCFQMGIIWDAAYQHRMETSDISDPAAREQDAVDHADLVFRRSNPAFADKDLIPGQRGHEITRAIFTLGSDTATMQNVFMTGLACLGNKRYNDALMVFMPLMLTSAWMEYLRRAFSKEEMSLSGIVVHGALGPVIDNFYLIKDVSFFGERVIDRGATQGVTTLPMPPALRIWENMFKTPASFAAWLSADTASKEQRALRDMEYGAYEFFGVLLRLPGGAIRKFVHGVGDLLEGETSNPLVIFGIQTGGKKE